MRNNPIEEAHVVRAIQVMATLACAEAERLDEASDQYIEDIAPIFAALARSVTGVKIFKMMYQSNRHQPLNEKSIKAIIIDAAN